MLNILTMKLSPLSTWATTFVMAGLVFASVPLPVQAAELTVGVFAHEFSFSALITAYNNGGVAEFLAQYLIERIADNPGLSMLLMSVTVLTPVLGLIASHTKNPIDNAVWIFLNKVLQSLSYSTSKNQPDVLSWRVMLTNRPTSWADLIAVKAATDIVAMQDRMFYPNNIPD